MESYTQINLDKRSQINIIFARFAFIILCVRGYFSPFIEESIYLTLFLNLIIVLSIDYQHIRKLFFVFGGLSLITVYNREVLAIIDILAMVYILKGTPLRFLVRTNAIILFVYLIVWTFSIKLGILQDKIMVMPKGIAHCMGYSNSNLFGMVGFNIISTLFLLGFRKCKILVFLSIPVINECFYKLSLARTPWIGGYVMMLVMVLMVLRIIRPWMRYMVGILPVIILLITIYFAKHISQYPELDILFTTRFSNYANMLQGMSPLNWLIGKQLIKNAILDGSYMALLFYGGIVSVILFWSVFYKSIVNHWKAIYPFLPFILAMLANGIGENTFSSASGMSVIFWYIIFSQLNLHIRNTNYDESRSSTLLYATKG